MIKARLAILDFSLSAFRPPKALYFHRIPNPPPCTWVKPRRFGSFLVLCFLALGGHCLQMLCLPGFGTHANTQNLPHFRAFPASIQEHSPPKCLFFMANAKLPNRPVFALLHPPLPISSGSACLSIFCEWVNNETYPKRPSSLPKGNGKRTVKCKL